MYLDVHMYLCFNMQTFYSQSALGDILLYNQIKMYFYFIPHKFIQPENLLQTCQSTHPLSIWPVKKKLEADDSHAFHRTIHWWRAGFSFVFPGEVYFTRH